MPYGNSKKEFMKGIVSVIFIVLGAAMMTLFFVMLRIEAHADEEPLQSRGNIIFGDGAVAFYESDMDYIKNEIDRLYGEVE